MHTRKRFLYSTTLLLLSVAGWSQKKATLKNTGNPIIAGWYADPEAVVFGKTTWIYPTYSAPYEQQVFLDAFSSTHLKDLTKHHRIIDTAAVKWAKKAMWAPAMIKKD